MLPCTLNPFVPEIRNFSNNNHGLFIVVTTHSPTSLIRMKVWVAVCPGSWELNLGPTARSVVGIRLFDVIYHVNKRSCTHAATDWASAQDIWSGGTLDCLCVCHWARLYRWSSLLYNDGDHWPIDRPRTAHARTPVCNLLQAAYEARV